MATAAVAIVSAGMAGWAGTAAAATVTGLVASVAAGAIVGAVVGGVVSAAGAALTGGDVGSAFKSGIITGAIAGGIAGLAGHAAKAKGAEGATRLASAEKVSAIDAAQITPDKVQLGPVVEPTSVGDLAATTQGLPAGTPTTGDPGLLTQASVGAQEQALAGATKVAGQGTQVGLLSKFIPKSDLGKQALIQTGLQAGGGILSEMGEAEAQEEAREDLLADQARYRKAVSFVPGGQYRPLLSKRT